MPCLILLEGLLFSEEKNGGKVDLGQKEGFGERLGEEGGETMIGM